MKKHIYILFLNLCLGLFMSSCNGPATTSDEDLFTQQNSVCMFVGRQEYIGPSFGPLQISNNVQKHIYRAGIPAVVKDQTSGLEVEVVEECYVLVLEAIPGAAGSTVKGKLLLRSSQLRDSEQTYSNVEFTVKKVEGDLVWLWATKEHIGVVIRSL